MHRAPSSNGSRYNLSRLLVLSSLYRISRQYIHTSVIRWYATDIDDDTEDYEAHTSQDLDRGQYELHFAISSDTKDLNERQNDEKHGDPYTDVDTRSCQYLSQLGYNGVTLRFVPKSDRDACRCDFKRQDSQPL